MITAPTASGGAPIQNVAPHLATPGEELLRTVADAYERGRILDALRQAVAFAPLHAWGGARGCVLASRMASHAGARRLAARLSARAWRSDPSHPDARAQYCYETLGFRGPVAAWQLLRRAGELRETSPAEQAELLALEGRLAADVRDFGTARQLVDRAEALDPQRPWIRLQRSHLLEAQDRIEEALVVAQDACALHPFGFYRAGVQFCAHLLQLLDRDDDAIRLLQDAVAGLQSGTVAGQLYSLLAENGRWAEAEAALETYEQLSPLLERVGQRWVAAERVRIAYHLGRRGEAARLAVCVDDDFHRAFAGRIEQSDRCPDRLQLDVTFVRQHFKTCAPATLAALGRFWQLPAEHLAVAEAVCYDGTPHWQQREWAEANGWHVRSFRVTRESAAALLERGVPFAITTVEATSSHMMAVVGIDRIRDTILLRDPSQPYVVEAPVHEFLERYRAFGPRGTVFVPQGASSRLDGVALDDAALYDDVHRVALALERHDREAAAAAVQSMDERAPGHALTLEAHLDLATYDANTAEQARRLDGLLEQFPGSAAHRLRRVACLRDASRDDRVRFLETACAPRDADPALLVALGRTYLGDARGHRHARRHLTRALRRRPLDSGALGALADLEWERGELDEAAWLYRVVAGLESFAEHFYRTWFQLCRRTRRTAEAIAHLEDRVARLGSRSEQPALTLAWAWQEMEQPDRAREVLDAAIRLRPADGTLKTRAASLMMELGDAAAARRLVDAARGAVRESDWLRAAAEVAERGSDAAAALAHARDLLAREPLALDAHATAARSLARLEGLSAALDHLERAAAASPHHYGLRRMIAEWSSGDSAERVDRAASALLALEPSDAWARRERALALVRLNRSGEALEEAREAARIEPRHSFSFSVLARVCRHAGDAAAAQAHFRRAIELSVDNGDAIASLLEMAVSDVERRAELALIERELIRQVVTGDGLLAYLAHARAVLEPQAVLERIEQAHRERPDLWHAWSALVSQLARVGRLDAALTAAEEATRRFRHVPRVWLDLATVHRWRNEPDAEHAAAGQAFELAPGWPAAAVALADALERSGDLDRAQRVYERALRHAPQDAGIHGTRASLLWRQRRSDEALEALERALRLAPDYEWAWDQLSTWGVQSGQPLRAVALARAITRERPGKPAVWLTLASLVADADPAEQLAAIERAIALNPRSTDAWDAKAVALTAAERFGEAAQACDDGGARCLAEAYRLRGRRAWVEARRGRTADAVRQMRDVLSQHASYVWGWHQLANWLAASGSLDEAGTALERLRQLLPHDAWINRELGDLRLRQGSTAAAADAFSAALRADPTDVAAAHSLLDTQLEAGQVAAAGSTVALMELHQPGAATQAAAIRVQLARAQVQPAMHALDELCASPDPDPWPLGTAAAAFERAGEGRRAIAVLRRALTRSSCNPEAAAAAVRLLLNRKRRIAATWLFMRLPAGDAQRRAAAPLVEGLAQANAALLFRWLFWRRRAALSGDDQAWGHTGFALAGFKRFRDTVRWLQDWRTRPALEPWMLFNLVLALRHLGNYREATRVASHVLETWPHRDGAGDMHLFLAVEEALAGRLPAAQEHLAHTTVRESVEHDQQLAAIARAVVDLQLAPRAERRARFREIRGRLAPHVGPLQLFRSAHDVRRTFWRAGKVLRREGAGLDVLVWCAWRLHWHRAAIPIGIAFLLFR